MTKTELIKKVAETCELPTSKALSVLNTVLGTITDELVRGGEVNLSGFGKFSVRECAAREGTNPRTGTPLQIPAHKLPRFTAGRTFKGAVNS